MAGTRGEAPKRGRVLSFTSNKSDKTHRSSGSGHKISLIESHEEKLARQLHTKADPNSAMNEAQPAMVAALEKSNLASLRASQYKDQFGNPITDPDVSNPTRYRFERPLDTIRSFEAAVEGSWNTRRMSNVSYARTEEASQGGFSRRGSYFGPPGGNGYNGNGYHKNNNDRYNEGGNNYWNRPSMSRPDSFVDNYGGSGPNQPYSPHYPYNNNYNGRQRPRFSERMHSEPAYNNGAPNVYPQQGYQKSYDNVTAGSVNSSLDRLQQAQPPKTAPDSYGFNGFGPGPQNLQISTNNSQSAPPPPPHGASTAPGSQRIVFGTPAPAADPNNGGPVGGARGAPPPVARTTSKVLRKNTDASDTKRKNWFKKRFSKA